MMSGGELIRQCRKFRGYTQRELAAKAGVNVATINNAECGRNEPTYFTVCCCLNAMGFSLELTTMEGKK